MEPSDTPASQGARDIFEELELYYDDQNIYYQTIGAVRRRYRFGC